MSGTVTASSGPKTADLTPPGIQAWSKPTYLKTKSKNTTKQNISLQIHTAPCRQGMNHTRQILVISLNAQDYSYESREVAEPDHPTIH